MIPRIHQFWPHSYPRHQRRQSQRSSSEVGKSPLASTHIGDQLVLTPYDDKFPPPRRKNLSAVAPSRDPKANHTQRQYKSSIPNRFDIFHTKGFFTSYITWKVFKILIFFSFMMKRKSTLGLKRNKITLTLLSFAIHLNILAKINEYQESKF